MEHAGVAVVGPSTTKMKEGVVAFPQAFETVPVVVANTLQDPSYAPGSIGDTFAVSITGVSTMEFSVNIVRVDSGSSWEQNLRLGWIATTP